MVSALTRENKIFLLDLKVRLLIMRDHLSLNKNTIIIGTGFLNPLLHEDPPILTITPFLQIFSNPFFPIPLPFFLMPCFFRWKCDCVTSYMLFYIIIWHPYTHTHTHMHSYMYARTHACMHSHTHTHTHMHACIHTHTHTQIHTQQKQGPIDRHINIIINTVMFSEQLSVLYWINYSLISNAYFPEVDNIFALLKLIMCGSHIPAD